MLIQKHRFPDRAITFLEALLKIWEVAMREAGAKTASQAGIYTCSTLPFLEIVQIADPAIPSEFLSQSNGANLGDS